MLIFISVVGTQYAEIIMYKFNKRHLIDINCSTLTHMRIYARARKL